MAGQPDFPGHPKAFNTRKLTLLFGGSVPPSNTWFFWPSRVFMQNGISIGLAGFAQLTVECPITLQWASRCVSPKVTHFPLGIGSPSSTWYLGFTRVIIPNGIAIGLPFSRIVWVLTAMLYNMHCQWGTKPQNCHFPLRFRHPAGGWPSHGDRPHAQ